MPIVRECVRKMKAYVPGEASDPQSVVKLNQNENRYPPSPKVAEAIHRAMDNLQYYPDSTSARVREAAARVYGVRPDEVMVANGSDEMLCIAIKACCDPGDEIVAFNPSYTYYATLAAMHDTRYRMIDFEGEFNLPANLDLDSAKMVILPNPNAPTGTLFPEAEIRRLARAVRNGILVLDEAYADYSGYTSMPLIREFDNLMVVRTFSKSYSLAGLRLGLGFCRTGLMAEFEKVRDFYNVDRLAQAGAEAALLDQEWLKYTSSQIVETRNRTVRQIRDLGLKAYDSASNFILVRCRDGKQAKAIFEGLKSRNVMVRYFSNPGIDDCFRVSVGTEPDMAIFIKQLENVLGSL